VEQTVGAVLGMAIMTAFEVGRDAGIPAEALVLEMYMSGEMEIVFRSFRKAGFFRSSGDHGPTAVFGGMLRTLEMDRDAIMTSFRATLEDIKSGGFARRFQEEAKNGYHRRGSAASPALGFTRAGIRATRQGVSASSESASLSDSVVTARP
jgi:ketol-acid reductoisomerase